MDKGARFDPYTGQLTNVHTTGERLRSEGPQKEYRYLHVGPATSLITDIKIAEWGTQVLVSCLYDPLGARKPYIVLLHGCSRIDWNVHTPEHAGDTEADVIGFEIRSEARDHALIATDIFELSIWYNNYEVVKDW